MSVTHKINGLFVEWDNVTKQYQKELANAAHAEVEHKREKARFIVRARAEDPKLSATQAEMEADADDEIADLYLARLGTAAMAEATKHRLFMLRAKSDALRSEKVDERESNRLYAENAV